METGSLGGVSWGVVATVCEPPVLVQAFLAHHLHLGAEAVYLCFDDPEDPAADLVEHVPGCHVIRCDAAWWRARSNGKRPPPQTRRQHLNATYASDICGLDFLLHCDADEFLHPEVEIADELARVPSQKRWLKLPNRERAYVQGETYHSIFDGTFKHFLLYVPPERIPQGLFNHPWSSHGFIGHGAGKSMVRAGQGLQLGIHVPRLGRMQDREVPKFQWAHGLPILHFDGLTPLHWGAKMLRYAALGHEVLSRTLSEERIKRVAQAVLRSHDLNGLRWLYLDAAGLSVQDAALLHQAALLDVEPFDPGPALRKYFPDQNIDLSIAGFDHGLKPLIAQYRRQIAKLGEFDIKKAGAS